jgi:hypothetical protein
MATNRIRISVEGDPKDQGHVRLNEFLQQLDAVRQALRHTQELIPTENRNQVYYRIIKRKRAGDLIPLSNNIAGHQLTICKPQASQRNLLSGVGPLPDTKDKPDEK